jgi:hypothetical protein
MSERLQFKRTIARTTLLATGAASLAGVFGCGNVYPSVPSHSPQSTEANASASPTATSTLLPYRTQGQYCDDRPADVPKPLRGNNVYAIHGECLNDPNYPVGVYQVDAHPDQHTSTPAGQATNGTEFGILCIISGEVIQSNEATTNTDTQHVRTSTKWWAEGTFPNGPTVGKVMVPLAGLGLYGHAADSLVNDQAHGLHGPVPLCS